MGSKLTWEWTFPTGEIVTATLELPAKIESVSLGARLLSRSPPGGKRDGHAITLTQGEARVDFDAETRQAALTQGGAMVPPTRVWSGGGSSTNTGLIVGIVVGLVVLLGVFSALAAYGVKKYRDDLTATTNDKPLTQTYKSKNGLLISHYPADFAANSQSDDVLQIARGGLRDDSILLMSIVHPVSSDPVELGRIVLTPIYDVFTQKGSYTELTHTEGKCLGHAAHVTTGDATLALEAVNTWSCTFVANGHGYIIFMSVNKAFADDDKIIHKIIDATEIVTPAGTNKLP